MNIGEAKLFIKNQLSFFMKCLVNYDKLFIPDRYDLITQLPASTQNMVNDLGDYIQYLYAADCLLDKEYEKDVLRLLTWTFDQDSYRDFLATRKFIFKSTIDTGDFLVGLNSMLHGELPLEIKKGILKTIDDYLLQFYPDNFRSLTSLYYKNIKLPIFYCYSIYNDIEELVYIFEYTKDEKYLHKAKQLYAFLASYKVNRIPTIASITHRFVNQVLSKFNFNFYTTILSKTMSNFCSASICLSRYDSSIELQEDVIAPLLKNFYDQNRKRFTTTAGNYNFQEYNLSQNHPAISLFIDYELDTDFDAIGIIEEIINENETFPFHFFKSQSFHLDSIVDFATILLKLHEKTQKARYLDVAQKYLEFIDINFRTQFGFFIQGDKNYIETVYSTKFQSLVLKPYLLLCHILEGKSIFKDRFIYLLSRDR